MLKQVQLPLLFTTALLDSLAFASDVSQLERCGTLPLTPQQIMQMQADMKSVEAFLSFPVQGVTIPVAFHIITGLDDSGKSAGYVDDKQLAKQIAVLNQAFIGTGFRFKQASAERTFNDAWFDCKPHSDTEQEMKKALAVDPAHTFNIYSCNTSPYISWATFPFTHPEKSPAHGIVMHYDTMPGGIGKPYNLGDVAVHETGHYLGLLHTFENGCQTPGDVVEDTAYEKAPNYGCNQTADSCKGFVGKNSGKDPIFNYMDFTTDACMREFTRGQIERMQAIVALFKPSLIN